MKIILARCESQRHAKTDALITAVSDELRRAGHVPELITIPPIGDGLAALMSLASHRMMNLRTVCDAVICMDRISCVMNHSRKYAILPDQSLQSQTPISAYGAYLASLLDAGTMEAKKVKVSVQGEEGQSPSSTPFDFSLLLRELK